MSLEVGSVVEGVVTGITNFGVFIKLPGGETGLVHISEIADSYVKDINEHLQKKDKVKVKVLCIDGGGKIGLSIKQANKPTTPHRNNSKRKSSPGKSPKPPNFEDKLSSFFKESDEKQQDLKKNTESKRGGRSTIKQELS